LEGEWTLNCDGTLWQPGHDRTETETIDGDAWGHGGGGGDVAPPGAIRSLIHG